MDDYVENWNAPAFHNRIEILRMRAGIISGKPHTDNSLFEASNRGDVGALQAAHDNAWRPDPAQLIARRGILFVMTIQCLSAPRPE